MVEVLEKKKQDFYRITCHNCDSVLKFTEFDEKEKIGQDMSGKPRSRYHIECPVCKTEILTRSITNEGACDWRTKFRESKE